MFKTIWDQTFWDTFHQDKHVDCAVSIFKTYILCLLSAVLTRTYSIYTIDTSRYQ